MTEMAEIIELYDEEAMILDGDVDIVIPFSFTYSQSLKIEVYPMFRHIAEEFLKKFGEDEVRIFSDEAISWIIEAMDGVVSELGFDISEDSESYYIKRSILPSDYPTHAVPIESEKGLKNLTLYDIDETNGYGCLCFGVIEDGKILSVACTNATVDDDTKVMEIGVETADGHGGHGYGRDAISALANELHSRGIEVHYEYASDNPASESLVKGLNTKIIEKSCHLIGIRK